MSYAYIKNTNSDSDSLESPRTGRNVDDYVRFKEHDQKPADKKLSENERKKLIVPNYVRIKSPQTEGAGDLSDQKSPQSEEKILELFKDFARNTHHKHIYDEFKYCKFCGFSSTDEKNIQRTCDHSKRENMRAGCGSRGKKCLVCNYIKWSKSKFRE